MNVDESVSELMSLRGRVAAITGGAGYLGRTMAEALAELGASVVVIDSGISKGKDVAASLEQRFSVPCLFAPTDLNHESQILAARDVIDKQFQKLDILINCAALVGTSELKGWAVPFAQQKLDTWNKALAVNLTAPFIIIQACLGLLYKSSGASIINIGSIYGMVGPDWSLYEETTLGNPAAYAASKGGLAQFTRWLATTLGPRIRANSIVPGGIARGQTEHFVQRYIKKVPLGRMGTETDFKGAVAFLASDLSRYVTGQELVVDGGFTAW